MVMIIWGSPTPSQRMTVSILGEEAIFCSVSLKLPSHSSALLVTQEPPCFVLLQNDVWNNKTIKDGGIPVYIWIIKGHSALLISFNVPLDTK